MAGSIGYVSFPHFKPCKRKSVMSSLSTMCLQLKASLPTFSRFRKCFSRSSKTLRTTQNDAFSRECLLPGPNDDNDEGSWSSTESETSSPTNEQHATLSTFPPLVQSHSTRLANKTSTRDQSPAASFRSATNRLRAGLTRRLTWRSEISESEEPTDESSADDEASAELRRASSRDLIADLDALALSQQDLELLRRMERVSRAASASPHRRRLMREPSGYWGDGFGSDAVESQPRLRLRGGGGDDDVPFRGPRRRTTLPQRPSKPPLPDDARPTRALWWLTGGMGRPPKYGGLRVSKEVEVVNRELVGFVGTLFGIRKVGNVGILPREGSGGDSGDDVAAGDAVMAGARGGSLKGSSLGGGLDAQDPGMGAGSVKSAPGMSEAGSVRSAATGGVKPPEKSMKGDVGDGIESGSKSAKSVIDHTADSEGDGAAAEAAEHGKAKSSHGD